MTPRPLVQTPRFSRKLFFWSILTCHSSFFGLGNVMGPVVQGVLDRSKLEITLMRITQPTKE